MVDLKKWANSKSTFIRIGDGESITAVFKSAKEIDDTFNKGQTKISYLMEVDGEEKALESMSASLARQMANIEEGEIVKISRTGDGRNTKWVVGKVVTKDEIDEITEEDLDKVEKELKNK